MNDDGRWRPYGFTQDEQEKGATLSVGPVFYGDVSRYYSSERGRLMWRAKLDGDCGGYSSMDRAKAHVEWEIWNRVRQMIPAYKVVLARREFWQHGGGEPPVGGYTMVWGDKLPED